MDDSTGLTRPGTARRITTQVDLSLSGPQTGPAYAVGALEFDAADPYAVSVLIDTGPDAVRWTFARDLLASGCFEPTGMGDVHVWPCLGETGNATVIVELTTDKTSVVVEMAARQVRDFLDIAFEAVPAGAESDYLDLDRALAESFPH